MLGIGKVDKNRPKNSRVLMQMENFTLTEQLQLFHSSCKGTSRGSVQKEKKKCSTHFIAFKGPKLAGFNCNLVWHLLKNNTEAQSPSRTDTIAWQQSQNSFQLFQDCKKENWLLMSSYCPCKHPTPSFLFDSE